MKTHESFLKPLFMFRITCLILTQLTASAAHSHSILLCGFNSSVSTSPDVLSKAEVVVRAHIDDFLHHLACVPEKDIRVTVNITTVNLR